MTNFFKAFILFFLLFSGSVFGQNLIGFNAFYMQTKIAGDSSGMNKMMFAEPGSGFGIAYKHMELRNIIGFQGEINIQNTGFMVKPQPQTDVFGNIIENDTAYFYKMRSKHINIPLFMHLDFGQHSVKAVFAIGTYADFLLEKSNPETNMTVFDSTGVERIANGKYNTFTYGLTSLAGIAFCTKYGVFQFAARASLGMSKMIKIDEVALLSFITDRSLGFGFSYFKPFGKEPYYTKKEKIKKEEKLEETPLDIPEKEDNPNEETSEPQEEKADKNAPTEEDLDWEQRFDN
ncbi:MAG: outer membrane beta-barrel protein [Bacteroidales bacterium]|nr:outer membrane beta-barrel protein [Bacteroidales bacterium]